MKIPMSLIQSLIHLDLQPAQIAETFTLLGLEVDRIENEHPSFAGVVVGEILSAVPHPNGSKLTIAQVSDGRDIFQIVCGASNCRAGMKTAFAKPGALLKQADGKQIKIEKTTIRGTESAGMLCSEEELGISSRGEGIIELPNEAEAGKDLVQLLWDPVFEISLTPNLGHCMSALGLARELSAALQKPLRLNKPQPVSSSKTKLESFKVASINHKLAPRYMGRLIEGVSIGPSPFWLQKLLLSCGLTPICNAVDIANYILFKLGQPLHVFDADRIKGGVLHVEASNAPQKWVGLDQVQREIPAGTILISDAAGPIAIGGILGGENSAVSDRTTRILIEAAVFDPTAIRQASKKMGLRTDSSHRFEKGIDPNGLSDALDEATDLILKLCGGEVIGTMEQKSGSFAPKSISCRSDRVNRLLGTRLSLTEIQEIFSRLGFTSQEKEKGILQVEVPLYRHDISEEIDLVEEVARIYGYNHIEKPLARSLTSSIPHDPSYLFEKEVRERLIGFGLQEFLNSDLISKNLAKLALEWIRPGAALLTAVHAKTEEYSVLRPSLLPGLLQSALSNFNQKNQTFAAFEIGRIHFQENNQLVEEPMAALILTGKRDPLHWSRKVSDFDFFDLKGQIENLFDGLRIAPPRFQPAAHLSFHPGRQADIYAEELKVGSFGEVHPALLEAAGIKQRILFAELNLHLLQELPRVSVRMKPLPQFPASDRDWTLSLPSQTLVEEVLQMIRSSHPLLLEKVELIDLYIPETGDKKNATFRFTYRDPLKTISFEEVENTHTKLVESVAKLLAK